MTVSISEKEDFLLFGEKEYAWPISAWRESNISMYVGEKISNLEKNFKKKDVQYMNLQNEFREVFEMDDNSDEE
jgi:hypothetical protein